MIQHGQAHSYPQNAPPQYERHSHGYSSGAGYGHGPAAPQYAAPGGAHLYPFARLLLLAALKKQLQLVVCSGLSLRLHEALASRCMPQ